MKRIVNSRWFGLIDLACVLVAVILCELEPRWGWRPLLIAISPWILRICAGQSPVKRTRFDLPLVIFLLTAAVGVWAAYDRENAQAIFWLLTAAVLLYYAFAAQPQANLWIIAGILSLVGVGISIVFLFTNDFQTQSAKISYFQQIGIWWMSIRPGFPAGQFSVGIIHPNSAAGITAFTIPMTLAILIRAVQEKRTLLGIGTTIAGLLAVTCLLLSTSRGAWVALGFTALIFFLWVLSGILVPQKPRQHRAIFCLGLTMLVVAAVVLALAWPGGITELANLLPGPAQATNRLDLAHGALDLIADFPFTGGGLGAFTGLYSQYILGIPFEFTTSSHNMFLNAAIGQGIVGCVALVGIFLGSILILIKSPVSRSEASLRWATLAGILVILVHGLVDDVVYYTLHEPLLFMLPGMAVAVSNPFLEQPIHISAPRKHLWRFGASVAVAFTVLVFVKGFRQSLQAAWYADLGAVQMARTELANFPSGQWDNGQNIAALAPAEALFNQALRYNPGNLTAHYRLGLINLLRRDFTQAVLHLEKAFMLNPNHRGIHKALGYSYTWSGQYDQALKVLTVIPEAKDEMNVYTWWWTTQGRSDLASNAASMSTRLAAVSAPVTTFGNP